MFQVNRFDPKPREKKRHKKDDKQKEEKKLKRKHPTTGDDNDHENDVDADRLNQGVESNDAPAVSSTLHVIAPEAESGLSLSDKKQSKLDEEAFDDLDVIEQQQQQQEPNQEDVEMNEDPSKPSTKEIQSARHMTSLSTAEAAAAWDLPPFLVNNLQKDGYDHFFPIQALVIPDIIASERYSHIRAQDICVSAPTGSGKTLAFVIPILAALANRKIKRLRALVVLPSRDLAQQVHDVFQSFTTGSDLCIGLAIGQTDFREEQLSLIVDDSKQGTRSKAFSYMDQAVKAKQIFNSGDLHLSIDTFSSIDAWRNTSQESEPMDLLNNLPKGGLSAVDVLVCTPGRLVDHMDNTPGFTLQHLRYLVVDEADRLLSQTYHNWVGRVIDGANLASVEAWHDIVLEKANKAKNGSSAITGDSVPTMLLPKEAKDGLSCDVDMITWRRGGTDGDDSAFSTNDSISNRMAASVCQPVQLRKLLYSATLTRDPKKLASLRLVNPKHFDARQVSINTDASLGGRHTSEKYTMPPTLSEFSVECTAEQKPLVLLALLLERTESMRDETGAPKKNFIVVFTSSLDSTHRLSRLLQILWYEAGYGSSQCVAEFSSALNQKERSKLMKRCVDPNDYLTVIVCSDGMARGMDIDLLDTVINYDVPNFAKTYVHRCGRTARAGKEGTAISLLKGGQVGQFSKMRRLIDHPDRVKPMGVKKNLVRDVVSIYRNCLKALEKVLAAEAKGELKSTDDIPPSLAQV